MTSAADQSRMFLEREAAIRRREVGAQIAFLPSVVFVMSMAVLSWHIVSGATKKAGEIRESAGVYHREGIAKLIQEMTAARKSGAFMRSVGDDVAEIVRWEDCPAVTRYEPIFVDMETGEPAPPPGWSARIDPGNYSHLQTLRVDLENAALTNGGGECD